jgi:hypothetical protein
MQTVSALNQTIRQFLDEVVQPPSEPRHGVSVELSTLPARQLRALATAIGLPEGDLAAHLLAAALQDTLTTLPNTPERYQHLPTGQTVGLADRVAYELDDLARQDEQWRE